MSLSGDARDAGRSAIGALRATLAERAAALIRSRPEFAADAVEVGLVDRAWLDEPGDRPISTATPLEVVQRFLERSVEERPSALAAIGLNAIQLLSVPGEERRALAAAGGVPDHLTVVFTDLEGFTRFTARAGDEEASVLLAEHHRLVGPVVRSRGGRIVKRLGDGLMLAFPAPEAAVHASLELLTTAPEPLRLRAGAHVGEVIVTRDDLVGHVVNLAARVAESAKGGTVLVTEEVRTAVGDIKGVRFGRARRKAFKGVDELIRVYEVRLL